MENKILKHIWSRIEHIDDQLEHLGEQIGESASVLQTGSLRGKSNELLSIRRELDGLLRLMNRPVKQLRTIKYISYEKGN